MILTPEMAYKSDSWTLNRSKKHMSCGKVMTREHNYRLRHEQHDNINA